MTLHATSTKTGVHKAHTQLLRSALFILPSVCEGYGIRSDLRLWERALDKASFCRRRLFLRWASDEAALRVSIRVDDFQNLLVLAKDFLEALKPGTVNVSRDFKAIAMKQHTRVAIITRRSI
jgi:hypothetical protein